MATQLALGVQLPGSATLDAFVGATNAQVKAGVTELVAGRSERLLIHGPRATGKTHLLQAACRAIWDSGARSVHVPLAQIRDQAPALLAGFQDMDFVGVDGVDTIAGWREAELALLGLTDSLRARGARLLVAARRPPADIGFSLADLASRLAWGGVSATAEPSDDDKQAFLIERAAQRGMQLPPATARWLLRHGARDMPALINALDRLDHASLAAQRRLTIPFVKHALSGPHASAGHE